MKRRDFIRTGLVGSAGIAGAAGFSTPQLINTHVPEGVSGTSSLSATFDVKQFGAIGDGRSDDTVPVQAVIEAAAKLHGGARIYFPAGRYRITRSLVFRSSERIDITGVGSSSVLFHENDEPLLLWPKGSMCTESSVRHLCVTSAVNHKSRYTPVIACMGGAARSLFSHLLFNCAATGDEKTGFIPLATTTTNNSQKSVDRLNKEPVRMGSGIYVEGIMDSTTIEHCLMWGPVTGIGIRVSKGSEVRIIGGRILGSGNPYERVGEDSIGIHLTENNGGVHVVTTDLIGLGTCLKIGDSGTVSNREVFITHATFDSSRHGIVQVDNAYTSVSGCWAASCDEEQILLDDSAHGAIMAISGGTIFNGGAYERAGAHNGMVVKAGSFMLTGVTIRQNKGTGLLIEDEAVHDFCVTGCRFVDNGIGMVLNGNRFSITGNMFSQNRTHMRPEASDLGLIQGNFFS